MRLTLEFQMVRDFKERPGRALGHITPCADLLIWTRPCSHSSQQPSAHLVVYSPEYINLRDYTADVNGAAGFPTFRLVRAALCPTSDYNFQGYPLFLELPISDYNPAGP